MLPSPLDRWHDPALIDHLARVRAPWDALTRHIVRAACAKWLPHSAATVVEVGAGGGQLREWLPPEVAAAATHTESSVPYVDVLRTRHPDAAPGQGVVRTSGTAPPREIVGSSAMALSRWRSQMASRSASIGESASTRSSSSSSDPLR